MSAQRPSLPATSIAIGLPGSLADLLCRISGASQRCRQRRALCEHDARLLGDVGITRRQANDECRMTSWR